MSETSPSSSSARRSGGRTFSWRSRVALGIFVVLAVSVILVTNNALTDRFTQNTRNRAELRLALYLSLIHI